MKKKYPSSLSLCGAFVRKHNPDYFFCSLFLDPVVREHVFHLLAFYMEITRAVSMSASWSVAGPMAGLIRLQWWRDILSGQQDRAHEFAPFLLESVQKGHLRNDELLSLIAAKEEELDGIRDWDHWHSILLRSAGQIQKIVARLVGIDHDDQLQATVSLAIGCEGIYMARALPALLKSGRLFLPESLASSVQPHRTEEGITISEDHIRSIRNMVIHQIMPYFQTVQKPCLQGRKLTAVNLPVILAQRDLKRQRQWGYLPHHSVPRGIGDKLAVLRAVIRGRIRMDHR